MSEEASRRPAAQVLIASTHPLEIAQADRWAKANKSLKGNKLDETLAVGH
jgi:hypothetical protein